MKESILRQILHPGETFRVKISHIENPQRFFAIKFANLDELNKLQYDLEIEYSEDKQNQVIYFAKLHMCCALLFDDKWYRGCIEEINGNGPNDIRVRLVDDGRSVAVGWHQLHVLTERFVAWREISIECSLADVQPSFQGKTKEWTDETIAAFIRMTSNSNIQMTISSGSQFCYHVILNVVERHLHLNVGGLLVKFKHALSTGESSSISNTSLSQLAEKIDTDQIENGQQTLQSWYEKLKKALNSLPISLNDLSDPELLEKTDISNYDTSHLCRISEVVTEWLPAEPIEKTVFTCYPTYVDYDANVYLHDADQHNLLNRMRIKINEELDLGPAKTTNEENWAPGQPCLARYHLDCCLYRAVIHRLLPNKKFVVRFVDYGNIETCVLKDLYQITAFPNIPIQAVRYSIKGIQPTGGQEKFSTSVLDLIHGVIVDKMCGVLVAYGEHNKDIKKCSIRLNGKDLATYLIENKFAISLDDDD